MSVRKFFPDSVTPIALDEGHVGQGVVVQAVHPEHSDDQMTLLFSLKLAPERLAELEARVAGGEVVPMAELNDNYGCPEGALDALKSWLVGQGFEILKVSADGVGLYARAAAKAVSEALDVHMVRVTRNGLTVTAAANPPSLPQEVGESVHSIVGLQPFRKVQKHRRKCPVAASKIGTEASSAGLLPYKVATVLKAYNGTGVTQNGQGQTIGILIDTVPHDQDLLAFWKANGLSTQLSQIQKINVKGQTLDPPEGEETLDTQWTTGVAPAAHIRIYACGSLDFVDLDLALDRILEDVPSNPGMRQVSISLGIGETEMPADELSTQHLKFLKLAAAGVNVFVSSGDDGSNPDGRLQVEYQSSDPSVISVGGTSLVVSGTSSQERGWSGSGGGLSRSFPRPSWQVAPGLAVGKYRSIPDVSSAADPNYGALVVLNGQSQQIGGTSWSAPTWAGICALVNQARVAKGKAPLGFLNPLLYAMKSGLRDVQGGSNGTYRSGAGYDQVTGLGSPDISALIRLLS